METNELESIFLELSCEVRIKIIEALARHQAGLSVSELKSTCQCSLTATSHNITRLHRGKYVEKSKSKQRRVYTLTANGRRLSVIISMARMVHGEGVPLELPSAPTHGLHWPHLL